MTRPRTSIVLAVAIAACLLLAAAVASAGPVSTRIVYASGEIVPIPAAIPHEEGDMVDRRIVPDLRWIASRFPIYVVDGYSGPLPNGEHAGCRRCHVAHSDHYNGLAVDIVPLNGEPKCDASWRGITRLALWAEPMQNRPAAPFRWVGYDGDAGHGCGDHLHLSWEHASARQYELAEWVEVFPTGAPVRPHRAHRPKRRAGAQSGVKASPQPTPAPAQATPSGGFGTSQPGGVSVGD